MTTNTIKERLDLAEPIFLSIDDAIEKEEWETVFQLLDSPQPEEWIKKGKSEFFADREYEYNEIELLEAILNRICRGWGPTIKKTIIVQDKGQFAVTTILNLEYRLGRREVEENGIATVYAQSIKHLTIATPKSVTDAIKNACKRIGGLLGGNLNRGIEDLPVIQPETIMQDETDQEKEKLKEAIKDAKSMEEAESLWKKSPFRLMPEFEEIINFYHAQIKE